MRFGIINTSAGQGSILAHSTPTSDGKISKGTVLTTRHIKLLQASAIDKITVARLEAGDMDEDEAANAIAVCLANDLITTKPPVKGRSDLISNRNGLILSNAAMITKINMINPAVTLATKPSYSTVMANDVIGVVKIIPYGIAASEIKHITRQIVTMAPLMQVIPFKSVKVGLIQTTDTQSKTSVLTKTTNKIKQLLQPSQSKLTSEIHTDHTSTTITAALAEMVNRTGKHKAELIILFGARSICDVNDVIPAAITAMGGELIRFGIPTEPGHLTLLARLNNRIVVGAPGCARSPKANGFDWVLNRLLTELPLTNYEISSFGSGGLINI